MRKYIVMEDGDGNKEIVTFSSNINYDCMAEVLGRIRDHTHGDWVRVMRKPISAGFVSADNVCFGRSVTLGLISEEGDTELLGASFVKSV